MSKFSAISSRRRPRRETQGLPWLWRCVGALAVVPFIPSVWKEVVLCSLILPWVVCGMYVNVCDPPHFLATLFFETPRKTSPRLRLHADHAISALQTEARVRRVYSVCCLELPPEVGVRFRTSWRPAAGTVLHTYSGRFRFPPVVGVLAIYSVTRLSHDHTVVL